MMPSIQMIMSGLSLAIYWIGASLINNSVDMQEKAQLFSDMVVFSSYAIQVIMSFLILAIIFMILPRASVSAKRINEVLSANNINWTIKNKTRITEPDAMTLIKMAAFEVANNVMTSLASVHITAVIGNWVRARGKGVISGIDYGTAGEIDKIDEDSINTVLNNGFIPIFPCIGWSLNGKPYNISSMHLSSQIATKMNAEKLFFLIPDIEISDKNFTIPKSIGISPEGHIPAMNIEELDLFMSENIDKKTIDTNNISDIISALELSKYACSNGVSRTHLLNGFFNGALPCEIFSNLGAGTMIYSYDYGKIRSIF